MPRRLIKKVRAAGRESPTKGCDTSLLRIVLDGVTLEVDLGSFWKEALATLTTATRNDVTTGFSSHTCTEAMLTFADALGRLVGSLHGALFLKD